MKTKNCQPLGCSHLHQVRSVQYTTLTSTYSCLLWNLVPDYSGKLTAYSTTVPCSVENCQSTEPNSVMMYQCMIVVSLPDLLPSRSLIPRPVLFIPRPVYQIGYYVPSIAMWKNWPGKYVVNFAQPRLLQPSLVPRPQWLRPGKKAGSYHVYNSQSRLLHKTDCFCIWHHINSSTDNAAAFLRHDAIMAQHGTIGCPLDNSPSAGRSSLGVRLMG